MKEGKPATLRLTGSGVNAVGGEEEEGELVLFEAVEDSTLGQSFLQFINTALCDVGYL